jgi:branched-chain amino acid transport system permease protein
VKNSAITRLTPGLSRRGAALLAVLLAALLIAPWFVGDYLLTVLIVIFYLAFTGQAWNIMMGFAGQLSLGHAIYAGLGAYVTAALFTRFGIAPWLGLLAAMPVAAACGAIIGFLAFRFRVAGVYFAILTIAFAEFARIGFDHLTVVNASAGLFLPVAQYSHNDLWRLRGNPTMFYYVMLAATAAAFVLCNALLRSRIGYFWLAIREDEQAALAAGIDTFRYKMYAVMISAAVTSFAGVFYAFFYNNLFPEQVFNISRSIEMILGPIIGGVGTLFGPILGAFVLTGLAESVTSALAAFGVDLPGAKQIFYGICLLIVVVALPEGIWPWLARRLGIKERRP